MLNLTREEGESVYISGPCLVTVAKLRTGRVQLGFTARRDVLVIRTEVDPGLISQMARAVSDIPLRDLADQDDNVGM